MNRRRAGKTVPLQDFEEPQGFEHQAAEAARGAKPRRGPDPEVAKPTLPHLGRDRARWRASSSRRFPRSCARPRPRPRTRPRKRSSATPRGSSSRRSRHSTSSRARSNWIPGPTVTMFEVEIAKGVKVNRVTALSDDLALALAAPTIRILAPIPGKSYVGIEVPNAGRTTVTLGDVLHTGLVADPRPLMLAIGKDVAGEQIAADLASMPHLLIAGSTGTGKSVCINALIMSILMRSTPAEVRLILIDPKRIELNLYNGVPHLYVPVVTEAKEAASALHWAVGEMESRLKKLQKAGARNIGAVQRGRACRQGTRGWGGAAVPRHHHRRARRPDDGGRQGGRGLHLPHRAACARRRHPPHRGHAAPVDRHHHGPHQDQHHEPHRVCGLLGHRQPRHPRHVRRREARRASATCSSPRPRGPSPSGSRART